MADSIAHTTLGRITPAVIENFKQKRAPEVKVSTPDNTNDQTVFHDAGGHYRLDHQFRALRKAMELPQDCVLHSCRHTFCTRLGSSGVDAFTLQKLAGHSNITVSAR